MVRRLFLPLTLLVLLALSSTLVAARPQRPEMQTSSEPGAAGVGPSRAFAPDRLLVKFQADPQPVRRTDGAWQTGNASLDRLLADNKVQAARRLFPAIESRAALEAPELERIYLLHLTPGSDLEQAVEALAADPSVEWAEPDYLAFPAATTPNDPLFPEQWGLAKIQAPAAWDVTTGSAAVPIAIVDSGIDFSHPDLAGKLWVNPGEIAGDGLDNDNNGYIDDLNGWDFVNGDNAPADDYGHGTQVAGVAGAASNNALGIAGVCWGCRLMPVKVMQASGIANYSDIALGVLYAAQKGAQVINLSLGGYSDSYALKAALQTAAGTYNAVLVAGAGNDNLSTPFYPAVYPEVLAVAGTNQADVKASMSNFGTWVNVSAPAMDITTTFMGGDYGAGDGTSYATPFAAGIAGLLRSQNPGWSADMVRAHVIHTADSIDGLNPGFEALMGSGRVSADGAVNTVAQPLLEYEGLTINGVANGRPEPGSSADLQVTLYNDWADAVNVHATLTSSDPYVTLLNGSATYGSISAYTSATNATAFRLTVGDSAPYSHDMAFSLHLTADGGYTADVPMVVATSPGTVYVHGTISSQTWSNDRTYIIDNEAGVEPGQTLIIEPGTVVRFAGDFSLTIAGTLMADGTQEQPIIVDGATSWGQILFSDSSIDAVFDSEGNYVSGSILRYARVSLGRGVLGQSAAPYLAYNVLEHGGISCMPCDGLRVEGNQISQAALQVQVGVADPQTKPLLILGNTVTEGGMEIVTGGYTSVVVTGNEVYDAPDTAIYACGVSELSYNRVKGAVTGIRACPGLILHNLVVGTTGQGISGIGGSVTSVLTNTVLPKQGYAVVGIAELHNNNLLAAPGEYVIRADSTNVDATGNWWGTASTGEIEATIYDSSDQFGLGTVDYGGYLAGPEPTAPAYVTNVRVLPDTTLGIQTATFEVEFSRPMEQSSMPQLSFQFTKHGTWTVYNTSNSGLPHDAIYSIVADPDGSYWFATQAGVAIFSGTNWTIYNTANSGLPDNEVTAVARDPDGSYWFGTYSGGATHLDGTNWLVYNTTNSGLRDNLVWDIAVDPDGSHWFGTGDGVAHFDGVSWTVYGPENSGLPDEGVLTILRDPDGSHWFGTDGLPPPRDGSTWSRIQVADSEPMHDSVRDPADSLDLGSGGVARFDGANWLIYDTSNSALPNGNVPAIARDPDGSHWFGTGDGVAHFDGETWTTALRGYRVASILADPDGSHWYGTYNSGAVHFDGTNWTFYNMGLSAPSVFSMIRDADGSHWFGTSQGVAVLWYGPVHAVERNARWTDDRTYQATYDITSLIPRGDYLITVAGATGTDGIEIVPAVGYTFTVDYAGAIGDTTPPPVPIVEACASTVVGTLSASWSAYDPDSAITLYRYAIGTTPGGTEVINWISTTAPSFQHAGLGLLAGETYYVALAARNEGGLWSEAGIPAGLVAGSGACTTNKHNVYLPLVLRGY